MHENNSRNIEAVRRFNRFYTRLIGLLDERILAIPFSLSEERVIYEIAQHEKTTETRLKSDLGLDAGYLSRMLSSFEKRGLIERKSSVEDAWQIDFLLTGIGREAFSTLNSAAQKETVKLLDHLSDADQSNLICAMQTIETLLGEPSENRAPYLLRPPRPGDMGWVVHCHGVLYAREYGWDEKFEALVAGIVANFVDQFDPKKERCWIAEKDAENVGSIFLVKKD